MFIEGLWRHLLLLSFTVTAAATNFYGGIRIGRNVCRALPEINANREHDDGRRKKREHKKNKKYKLFDPSNYSSSEFVDMSTITSKKLRKWFSLVPNVHDDDSIYRPFLKKKCFGDLINFAKILENKKESIARCLGLDFRKLGFDKIPQVLFFSSHEELFFCLA